MIELELNTDYVALNTESEFYANYSWCLNPIQKLRDLFLHMLEEFDRYDSLNIKWQCEESLVNMYLFACAISCTVDDFILWKPFELLSVVGLYPAFKIVILFVQSILNLSYSIKSSKSIRSISRWNTKWNSFVNEVCRLLLKIDIPTPDEINAFKNKFLDIINVKFPKSLLERRMKINEGYRCQDLTHHDILKMADKFLETFPDKDSTYVVIGPRTAGSYFAPLVKVYLEANGMTNVSWLTIRPKKGLSGSEKKKFRKNLNDKINVLLIDDYSNSGNTFRKLQKIIYKFDIPPNRTTILAPIHPVKPDVKLSDSNFVKVIPLSHNELYKRKIFIKENIHELIKNYFAGNDSLSVSLVSNPLIDTLNSDFEKHYEDSFQVRLKKLFEVTISTSEGQIITKRIFVKSVGWGWLGYHAYFAGKCLKNFVPEVLGLRNGMLFTEWVEGTNIDNHSISNGDIEKIACYIASRVHELKLTEDPRFNKPDICWGWLELLAILRRAYGIRTGYLKYRSLHAHLAKSIKSIPVLIDGRMKPEEWIKSDDKLVKTDFEQHNFGAPELDIVDPAYDLAAVCFEFQLSTVDEKRLMDRYISDSGDEHICDRLILYKLLYGTIANRRSRFEIFESNERKKKLNANQRYLNSWGFLNYSMNNFCSGIIKQANPLPKSRLFFMDIDGVFDTEVLGFPHTTISGILGMVMLENDGYEIIPNTGRSIENVQSYCSSYNFVGGIAEFGSVIWDNLKKTEIPLVKSDVRDQLNTCRQILQNDESIFIDTSYRYSIRAYRYNSKRTEGLQPNESKEVLEKYHLGNLKIINRHEDTYFVDKDTSKGNALKEYIKYIDYVGCDTAVIGDSDEDISMFEFSKKCYAPSNCSDSIKIFAKQKKCYVTSQKHQRGFYEAVNKLLAKNGISENWQSIDIGNEDTIHRLIFSLLARAEQPKFKKMLVLFDDRKL